jgi:hypothetical protein
MAELTKIEITNKLARRDGYRSLIEIRTLLDDARERTMALQARAAALTELVDRDANAIAHPQPPPTSKRGSTARRSRSAG